MRWTIAMILLAVGVGTASAATPDEHAQRCDELQQRAEQQRQLAHDLNGGKGTYTAETRFHEARKDADREGCAWTSQPAQARGHYDQYGNKVY
jgi:hypothetical protein